MYFVEGLANNRIAVVGKIHHALADGVASANLMARGMDLHAGTPQAARITPDPAPTKRQLMTSAFADHLRHLGRMPRDSSLHRRGHRPGAAQLAQVLAGTDPSVRRRRRPS